MHCLPAPLWIASHDHLVLARLHGRLLAAAVALVGVMTRAEIEARWGMPFWDLVEQFAAQELTRFDTGRALGMHPSNFTKILRANPDRNPFDHSSVVTRYVIESGETFGSALRRMAEQGYSLRQAATAIGFAQLSGLAYAMRVRGIEVKFCKALKSKVGPPVREGSWYPKKKAGDQRHPWRKLADREVAVRRHG